MEEAKLYYNDEKNLHHINKIEAQIQEPDKKWLPRFTLWILGTTLIIWGLANISTNDDLSNKEYFCPETINLYDEHHYTAEQIHLSLGKDETEMYVTWNTKQPINSEVVYYIKYPDGSVGEQIRVKGNMTTWTSKETDSKVIEATRTEYMDHYTYRALLSNLIPNSRYIYRIESFEGKINTTCRVYDFYTKNYSDPNSNLSIAFYGDLGLINGQSIPRLIKDVDENKYDFIIHNGDFAYDLNTQHGSYGDQFMRLIEPIAARVPYQTSVGNHEIDQLFLHYDQRFTMVNGGHQEDASTNVNNFYYSFNAGPIHFVAISTEHWYYMKWLGIKALYKQWEWLKKDLAQANEPESRAKRPWIIVYGHRPIYCSGRDYDDCSKETCLLRKGLPFFGSFALEKLLYDHGVDVELWSHEHQYERFLPIYNNQILNGTDDKENPYHNARGPVHIISGSAGCEERIEFFDRVAPGSVKQIADYGYTRIKSSSRCSIEFEQISDDQQGTRVDNFVISKTKQNFPTKSSSTSSSNNNNIPIYSC